MKQILCYGDSNTHGTIPMKQTGLSERYAPGLPWPDVMAAALGADYRVVAEGLPGRTTVHEDLVEGGARNGLAVLPAVLHSHKPLDLMVLMLGTNDLKPRFSVTAHEIARSVLRLAHLARAEAVVGEIVVVAPPPVEERGCLAEIFAGAQDRQSGLDGYLLDLSVDAGFEFVRAGDCVRVAALDGVHWLAGDHARFGAIMADVVRDRLS